MYAHFVVLNRRESRGKKMMLLCSGEDLCLLLPEAGVLLVSSLNEIILETLFPAGWKSNTTCSLTALTQVFCLLQISLTFYWAQICVHYNFIYGKYFWRIDICNQNCLTNKNVFSIYGVIATGTCKKEWSWTISHTLNASKWI